MLTDITPVNISNSFSHPLIVCKNKEDDINQHILHAKEVSRKNYAFGYYQSILKIDEIAIDWLKSRKIYHPDMLDTFKIGFADNALGNTLEHCRSAAGAEDRGILRKLGLVRHTGYQFFRQSMVFPFLNSEGEIIAAYGRRIAERAKNYLRLHLHWNQESALFFNMQALKKYKTVILCKSPIEALTLWCAGIKNVIAIMGVYSFDHTHLVVLEESGVSEVVIAFDNTDSCNYVSGMVAQSLNAVGITCRRLALPRNQDVNAFAVSQDDHVSALKSAVGAARPFRQTYSNLMGRG